MCVKQGGNKMKKSKSKMSHKLAAAVTAGMLMGEASSALAMDATNLVDNIKTSSKGFTDLIGMLGYIGGSGLAVAGIFKLKQHVDNPGQTPLKDGIVRLAAGGALLSLPMISAVMQGSISEGNGAGGAAIGKIVQFQ
jgi:hypothetical protein